jgi:hypothetical protein
MKLTTTPYMRLFFHHRWEKRTAYDHLITWKMLRLGISFDYKRVVTGFSDGGFKTVPLYVLGIDLLLFSVWIEAASVEPWKSERPKRRP